MTRNVNANLYFSSPVVAGGKVYVASLDEDLKGEGAIFALDAKTGELQWRYPVRNSIKNTIAVDEGHQEQRQILKAFIYIAQVILDNPNRYLILSHHSGTHKQQCKNQ